MIQSNWLTEHAIAQTYAIKSNSPSCKVCRSKTRLFDILDFGRQCSISPIYPDGLLGIPVFYHQCEKCGFVFTTFFDSFESQHWKEFIYNEDYARIDPDYTGVRSSRNARVVKAAIGSWWHRDSIGCDYGGGKGYLAERLRKYSLKFDSVDPFDISLTTVAPGDYSMVSAFEVIEHFSDPTASFNQLNKLCNKERCLLLISTTLIDKKLAPGQLSSWWYAAPRNGHISLYSKQSMEWLAQANNFKYQQVTRGIHLFGRGIDLAPVARSILFTKVAQKLRLL